MLLQLLIFSYEMFHRMVQRRATFILGILGRVNPPACHHSQFVPLLHGRIAKRLFLRRDRCLHHDASAHEQQLISSTQHASFRLLDLLTDAFQLILHSTTSDSEQCAPDIIAALRATCTQCRNGIAQNLRRLRVRDVMETVMRITGITGHAHHMQPLHR